MKPGRASRTAELNALFRALEHHRPAEFRLVDDPLAETLLSWRCRPVAALTRFGPWRLAAERLIDRRWPGVRTSVVARTRLIDDIIAGVLDEVGQIVVLGAGYDTRAWRLDRPTGTVVFEVDHPDTQRRKRRVLHRRGLGSSGVRFVATDLSRERLDGAMDGAGYQRSVPTLILWEGTTNYLTAEAVDATLRWCGGAAPGSHLIFTYVDRAVLDDPERFVGADRLRSTLARHGERLTFGLPPDGLADHLARWGLTLRCDLGAAEYRARCYGTAAQAMRGHEFYRVAHACRT